MSAIINQSICTGCEACYVVCPTEAIIMDSSKAVVNEEECVDCGACLNECPVEAISME